MTHIGDELERIWDHAEHSIANLIHHSGYHAPSRSAPEGTIMSLTSVITEAETALTEAKDFATHLENHPVYQALLTIAEDTPVPVLQQLALMIAPLVASLTATHQAALTTAQPAA